MGRKRILTLLLALMLTLATVGLAVPSINISVQEIGSGSGSVQPSTCSGGFYSTDRGLRIEIGNDLPAGTEVYASLYDDNGTLLATNSTTFSSNWPANKPFDIGFSSSVLNRTDFSRTRITILDGYANSTSGGISLSLQRLSIGNWSGEYAQPINITYSGGSELHNWPVKVVLSNSNPENQYGSGTYYIEWDVLQNKINSIHFVDENGRLLYYWIEVFHKGTPNNYDDAYAVIWVNVTDIPPGGTKIWMIYGKGDYSEYNNGSRVFPFFDDFEGYGSLTDGGWRWYDPSKMGTRITSKDNFEYGGSQSAERYRYYDRQDGVLKDLGFTVNRTLEGIILEYWDKRVYVKKGSLDRVGVLDSSGDGFGAVLNVPGDEISIDTRSNYAGTRHATKSALLSTGEWYFVRLEVMTNGTVKVSVYDLTGYLVGTPLATTSYYNDSALLLSQVYIKGGSLYRVDAMRVRFRAQKEVVAHVDEWYAYLDFLPPCSGTYSISSTASITSKIGIPLGAEREQKNLRINVPDDELKIRDEFPGGEKPLPPGNLTPPRVPG